MHLARSGRLRGLARLVSRADSTNGPRRQRAIARITCPRDASRGHDELQVWRVLACVAERRAGRDAETLGSRRQLGDDLLRQAAQTGCRDRCAGLIVEPESGHLLSLPHSVRPRPFGSRRHQARLVRQHDRLDTVT